MPEIVVARSGEMQEGERRIVQVGRREVGVFLIGGRYYALPNVCPHQLGPLCAGRLSGTLTAAGPDWRLQWSHEGEVLSCPWHGVEFHVPSGRCLAHARWNLPTYEVTDEDGEIKLRV